MQFSTAPRRCACFFPRRNRAFCFRPAFQGGRKQCVPASRRQYLRRRSIGCPSWEQILATTRTSLYSRAQRESSSSKRRLEAPFLFGRPAEHEARHPSFTSSSRYRVTFSVSIRTAVLRDAWLSERTYNHPNSSCQRPTVIRPSL